MVYIPGLGGSSFPGGLSGVPGAAGAAGANGAAGAAGLDAQICGLRLTSVSATPVLTSTQLAKTTLYDTPYKSSYISLYTGSLWVANSVAETSLSTAGFTASRVHDIYGYLNGSTYTLEAVAWSDNKTPPTRATQNGILTKNGATTRRFRGCVYVNASREIEWSVGSAGSGPVEAKAMIWNQDNRELFSFKSLENTASWTHANNSTWSNYNGSTSTRFSFVCGDLASQINAKMLGRASVGAAGTGSVAIARDVSNAPLSNQPILPTPNNATIGSLIAEAKGAQAIGLHYLQGIEHSIGNTTTLYGVLGSYQFTGLIAEGWF